MFSFLLELIYYYKSISENIQSFYRHTFPRANSSSEFGEGKAKSVEMEL